MDDGAIKAKTETLTVFACHCARCFADISTYPSSVIIQINKETGSQSNCLSFTLLLVIKNFKSKY